MVAALAVGLTLLALLTLWTPGFPGSLMVTLVYVVAGVALLTAASGGPTPPEVGDVASLLPVALGALLLAAVYVPTLLECRRRFASAGATS